MTVQVTTSPRPDSMTVSNDSPWQLRADAMRGGNAILAHPCSAPPRAVALRDLAGVLGSGHQTASKMWTAALPPEPPMF